MNVSLTNKKMKWQLMIILFFLFLLLPLSYVSLKEASETITQEIYDFARGSYDILIRPPNSRSPIEEELGLVEENYLGIGDGGITIEQWQTMLDREDIEVAAPVASVGLFTAPEITYQLPERKEALRYEVTAITTDGVEEYFLDSSTFAYSIPHEEGFGGHAVVVDDSLVNIFSGEHPSFLFPKSYHQVVAIDSAQEEVLTGINFNALNDSGGGLAPEEYNEIPILSLKNKTTPVKVSIQIDKLNINDKDMDQLLTKYNLTDINDLYALSYRSDPSLHGQVVEELQQLASERTVASELHEIDFSKVITPFYDNFLFTDENYQLYTYDQRDQFEFNLFGTYNYYSQQSSYNLSPVNYEVGDSITIKLLEVDPHSGVPIYRSVEKIIHYEKEEYGTEVISGDGIYFNHVGDFELVVDNEVLYASPLGIYGVHETYLAEDRRMEIYPTALPGSFISTPAHGLISLEWAEQLKGEAPIDAIRVKVAGIEGYDEKSAAKIRDIAQQFTDEGFTVDIIAGASHQWLKIDVEELGAVVQPWTTLGAADTIIESWNLLKVSLVLLFSIVSFVYVLFSCTNINDERKSKENQLRNFGWSEKEIVKSRLYDWGNIIGIPFLLALMTLTIYSLYFSVQGLTVIQFLVSLLVILTVIASFYIVKNGKEERRFVRKNIPIALKNSWFHRRRMIAAITQISILTITSILIALLFNHQEERTIQTTLGIYIHSEMEMFYIVLVSFLYLLSALTVIESLISLWRKRIKEMKLFFEIGWGISKIYNFYMKEVILWASFSIFVSAIFSIVCYQSFVGNVFEKLLHVSLGTFTIFFTIILFSVVVLTILLKRNTAYFSREVVK